MRAEVTKSFKGCRDGSPTVENFEPGDMVDGDLAKVAIENEWAKSAGPGRPKKKGKK